MDADPTTSKFKPNVLDEIRMLSARHGTQTQSVKEGTLRNCLRKFLLNEELEEEAEEEEGGEETRSDLLIIRRKKTFGGNPLLL